MPPRPLLAEPEPRRLVARLACALFLLLAALTPGLARADDPLRLWHAYRDAELTTLVTIVEQYSEAGGGKVELLQVAHESFGSKLAAAIPLGDGPDLFIDSHERIGDYRQRDLLGPADAAIESDAVFASNALAAVRQDGVTWAVPLSLKSVALYVNTDLIPVDRVPADLEAIAALGPGLPAGVYPLAYEAQNAYGHLPILLALGGTLLSDDQQFGLVGPAAERSLAIAKDLVDRGVVPGDADGALVQNLFRSGRAAFVISGPWLASNLTGDDVHYTVVPLPRVDGQLMRPPLAVESVMLSPAGANKPAAIALARHLAGPAAADLRQQGTGSLSARSDMSLPPGNTLLPGFAAQARVAVPMPATSAMRSAWVPANQALRKVLRGQASPADACAEAKFRFDDVRRPPPAPASTTPALLLLGLLLLLGALRLVQRARDPQLRQAVRRSLPAYRYVAHSVVAVGLLVILPLVIGALTSLYAGSPGAGYYVGLTNFIEILSARGGPLLISGSFYFVLLVTIAWTLLNVGFHLLIGLSLGLVLSRPTLRLRGLYRVLLIIPWAVPSYVTALAWKGMFNKQFGAVTGLIHGINDLFGTDLKPIAWFADFSTAFAANVATNVWLGFPFMMVVTLGALTAVPQDVLEAAEVDGASRWQRLRLVTLPLIRPALAPAVTLGAIWTFNMFNVVFLVSGGDPDGTTDILVSEAYRWAFTREAQYGYAAAYAVLIFLLLFFGTRIPAALASLRRRSNS
ncbi:extracellular solute-binding protein [Nannocystis sp.]|uniref:extracellular solute-binding protein n=1 Tax=Nannocystis sp. TaxID=1962667 RepID=UPI0025D2E116|nr:extracellular solute-binding protein [Nannocystis sp.]